MRYAVGSVVGLRGCVMPADTVRAHVVVPRELIAEIDSIVGQRRRSDFVVAALREKLALERQGRALKEAAGALADGGHPEWATPESTSAWVRALRDAGEKATAEKLKGTTDGEISAR